jgi:catechol 2,3-dioxygenase
VGTNALPVELERRAIDPGLRIGAAHLAVSDVRASVDFYTRILGLPPIAQDTGGASLGGAEERPALVLERLAEPAPATPHSTGLFHLAWLLPSRAALAVAIERVIEARWPIHGASDHGVSEALYLSDPDGLGIEIYADRARTEWPRLADGQRIDMFTRALDLDDLLAQAPLEREAAMPARTVLGHVHLKVSDLHRSVAFYRDVLGFSEMAHMPSAAFLSAGGYHHHIGLNTWQSRGAAPPSGHEPGLRLVVFELSSAGPLAELERRLAELRGEQFGVERAPGRLSVSDPDGNRLAFTSVS